MTLPEPDKWFGEIRVGGDFDRDGDLEILGSDWLDLGQVRMLHKYLGEVIHRERTRRGECTCLGFSHRSTCPEWVLPL